LETKERYTPHNRGYIHQYWLLNITSAVNSLNNDPASDISQEFRGALHHTVVYHTRYHEVIKSIQNNMIRH